MEECTELPITTAAVAPQFSSPQMVLAGGLQQFLIREAKREQMNLIQITKSNNTSPVATFHDLPDSIQLVIMSYLDARTLCRICTVCTHWHMLTSDEILWQRRLKKDMNKWHMIGRHTNPIYYKDIQDEWTSKDIYTRCSPEVQLALKRQCTTAGFLQLSSLFRTLLPHKTPLIAMYGPGLESSTSGVVRQMLQDKTGTFVVKGMFPGQFEGAGSGFKMSLAHGLAFNLTTLYTSTKDQRERNGNDRMRINRMLQHQPAADEEMYQLQPSIRQLCRTIDGFVFVVDASTKENTVSGSSAEMGALLHEVNNSPSIPLLVLNCSPTSDNTNCLSSLKVVEDLNLSAMHRPWQAHNCTVETLDGCAAAFGWLVEQTQRK